MFGLINESVRGVDTVLCIYGLDFFHFLLEKVFFMFFGSFKVLLKIFTSSLKQLLNKCTKAASEEWMGSSDIPQMVMYLDSQDQKIFQQLQSVLNNLYKTCYYEFHCKSLAVYVRLPYPVCIVTSLCVVSSNFVNFFNQFQTLLRSICFFFVTLYLF